MNENLMLALLSDDFVVVLMQFAKNGALAPYRVQVDKTQPVPIPDGGIMNPDAPWMDALIGQRAVCADDNGGTYYVGTIRKVIDPLEYDYNEGMPPFIVQLVDESSRNARIDLDIKLRRELNVVRRNQLRQNMRSQMIESSPVLAQLLNRGEDK